MRGKAFPCGRARVSANAFILADGTRVTLDNDSSLDVALASSRATCACHAAARSSRSPTRGSSSFRTLGAFIADWDGARSCVQNGPLRGPIKITASQEFGREELALIVDRFLIEYPDIEIALHLVDDVIDLV